MEQKDLALVPTRIVRAEDSKYFKRAWQGIPGIERASNGRLWATFYSGGEGEGEHNFVTLLTSSDDGATWSDVRYVIDPPDLVRAYDSCLWHDPSGRLWLFWAQSYTFYDGRCGVFAVTCDNSGEEEPTWSEPRRIADGIMMNKPTVLRNGDWLLPIAVWASRTSEYNHLPEERFSNVYCSRDQGQTFVKLGSADIPNREFDEHSVIERNDGSLWMLVRAYYGIGASESFDGGRSWTPGKQSPLGGPSSRFFIRRLISGRLLLVNHYQFRGRSHLTAMLSADDGKSWSGHLLLDERSPVSYPDGVQAEDGTIYIIYDFNRYKEKQFLLARFTEEDVLAGQLVSPGARLKHVINQA